MTNVVSFSSYKRRGTTLVRTEIHHRGAQSFVRFIDPSSCHKIDVTAAEARTFEDTLKANVGNEPSVTIEFLHHLSGEGGQP